MSLHPGQVSHALWYGGQTNGRFHELELTSTTVDLEIDCPTLVEMDNSIDKR